MADRNLELALRIRTLVQGAENVDDLRQEMGGLADELEQTGQEAQNAGQHFDNLEQSQKKAGEGSKEAKKAMDELKGTLAGIISLAAAKEILDLNDRLTGIKRGFETVTGSAEASDQALIFVNDTAKRLGTNALDLAQSFLKITASAKGTQLEGAPTEKIFSSIASAMATVNASGEDLERVMDAVGQMMGKGVVSAEELRGQLGDSLPGAVQQAAQALMVSNAELSKMLESGEVIAADFLPKFAAQLEKSMGGGGKQVEGFTASWNRLVNQFVEISTGPAGQGFTAFIAWVTDQLTVLTRGVGFASDSIGAFGRLIGGLAAGEFTTAFEDFGQSIEDASMHLMGAKTAAEQVVEQQKKMKAELAELVPAMDKFQDAVAKKDLKALPEYLQAAIAEMRKTGDVASATEKAISNFMAAPAKNINADGVIRLATSIQAVAQEAGSAGTQITNTLGQALAKLTDQQLADLEREARFTMKGLGDTEQARKAFADLGSLLEGVVLARFERLGVDGKEALTGISDAASDAIDDFTALASNAELSADTIEKAFEGALAKLDSPEELDTFKEKIIDLGKQGTLSGEQIERAFLLIEQKAGETADAAFDALNQKLADTREETDRGTEAMDRWQTVANTQTQAALELAKARGDEAEAARLSAKAAQEEVQNSKERLGQLQGQKREIEAHVQQLMKQAQADGVVSDAERKTIEALTDKSAALGVDIAKIKEHLPAQERESRQAEIMAGPIGELSRLYKEKSAAASRQTAAIERSYDAQIREKNISEQVARAKGDEVAAAHAAAEAAQLEADKAQEMAAAKAAEASAAIGGLETKKLEIMASDMSVQAKNEEIAKIDELISEQQAGAAEAQSVADSKKVEAEASKKAAESSDEHAKANQKASESSEKLATMVAASATQLMKLSAGTREMVQAQLGQFDAITRGSDLSSEALVKLKNGLESAEYAIRHNATTAGMLTGAWIKNYDAVNNTWKAYYEQAIAAENLTLKLEQMLQTQVMNEDLVREASEAATNSLGLLDKASLDRLQGAIDEAKQKLQELQDEANAARDRLSELNAELAREQGDTDTADQLELELAKRQALAEVEANLAKARAENNRDLIALYEAQLAKEQQLYDLKERNLKRDQEEARSSSRTETTHTTTTSGSAGVSSPTINVNVNAGNARLLDSRFKEELARDLKPIFDDLHRRLQ